MTDQPRPHIEEILALLEVIKVKVEDTLTEEEPTGNHTKGVWRRMPRHGEPGHGG